MSTNHALLLGVPNFSPEMLSSSFNSTRPSCKSENSSLTCIDFYKHATKLHHVISRDHASSCFCPPLLSAQIQLQHYVLQSLELITNMRISLTGMKELTHLAKVFFCVCTRWSCSFMRCRSNPSRGSIVAIATERLKKNQDERFASRSLSRNCLARAVFAFVSFTRAWTIFFILLDPLARESCKLNLHVCVARQDWSSHF